MDLEDLSSFYFNYFFLFTETSKALLAELKEVANVDLCASCKRVDAGLCDHVYACVGLPCLIHEIESGAGLNDPNSCFFSCQRQVNRGIFGPCILLKYGLNTGENELSVLCKVGSCPGLYAFGLSRAIRKPAVTRSDALFVAVPTSQNSMST